MERITIKLAANGNVRFLVNDATRGFLTEHSTVQRASHVEPAALLPRIVFHTLRGIFGENGTVAAFTRRWPSVWRVNLAPSNGPILPGRWISRKHAIAAEIAWLNENFI